jgi:outer membrane protein assembly factor BamD (BamD/ComL family)
MAAPTAEASLALLERHVQRFPNSTLTQEREVLTVKALMKLERVDEARARAAQFKERWPTSPHLLRVEALVGK